MKFLRPSTLIFIVVFIFVVIIDLPKNPYIDPVSIDINLFGKRIQRNFETKLGLDLKGGSHLLFETDISNIPPSDQEDALNSARDIIERRVNFFGVSEPSVQTVTSGNSQRIIVDLPGVENVDEAIALIGQTAQLSFREQAPLDEEIDATQSANILNLSQDTGLTGAHVKKASVQFDGGGKGGAVAGPSVGLEFNTEGAKLFEEITSRNVGSPVGIFLDNVLLSAPNVQQAISGGQAVITGNFTIDEANNLVAAINSGALPVPIELIEQRNIGPSLGQESIEKSIIAGAIGLLSVVVFMITYYRRLGLIAAAGLIIYGLLSYAMFKIIPVVLTLPGIAGFILSIGMAVDANILIFERIKEEQRKGKAFDISLRLGFGKAIDAIKDANIATLLVAFILFNPMNWDFFPQFGLIRGFALTLAIGVATSLFTGVVITKRLIETFYKEKIHI